MNSWFYRSWRSSYDLIYVSPEYVILLFWHFILVLFLFLFGVSQVIQWYMTALFHTFTNLLDFILHQNIGNDRYIYNSFSYKISNKNFYVFTLNNLSWKKSILSSENFRVTSHINNEIPILRKKNLCLFVLLYVSYFIMTRL